MFEEFLKGINEYNKPFLIVDNVNKPINSNSDEEEQMNYKSYKGYLIRKRKDNRWEAKPTIDKKQVSIYGKTQKECYENLKAQLDNSKVIKFEKQMTFYQYWEYWYNNYKAPFYKQGTLKNYRSVFKNQIQPNFQDKNIKLITALEINININKIPDCRMKEYTCQYLRECFKQAYKDKKIKVDIWEDIKKYHHKRKEGNALTEEQRIILLNNVDKIKHGAIFKFYLYSGARPAEGLNIAPSDIEKTMIRIPGTKTEDSDRWIPKFSQLQEIFENIDMSHKTIFNISEVTLKRERMELIKLCGFHFQTKDLRTTFATMCAEKGIAPKIIAKWLGHTTVNTTDKYYIKVLDKYEKEQISLLDPKFDPTKRT